MIIKIFVFLMFSSFLFSGPKERKLLPPPEGIYHTAFSTMFSASNSVSKDEVPYFVNLAGKKIVWLNFSNDWFNGIVFPESSVRNIWLNGAIPSIRIMPWSTYGKIDHTYSLKKILNGEFDKKLKKWAKELKKTGIPVMIDFVPEANGDWFPWCGINSGGSNKTGYGSKELADGPEMCRDAYRYLIELFRDEGVTNVTWVFHAAAISAPQEDWNSITAYYPGDDYIDWIGVSAYGPQRWGESYQRFVDIAQSSYFELSALTPDKPIAILEFGVADYLPNVNKALWIQSALYTVQQPEFSRIKAIGWWHSTWINGDGTMSAIQIDSSPESLRFYKEAIAQPVFVGEYRLSE
jgi:Glycosyl hydrolase family 26